MKGCCCRRCHVGKLSTVDGRGGSEPEAIDRAVVEQIRREALPAIWPAGARQAGAAVRVIQDADWGGPWRRVFTGVISAMAAPEPVVNRTAGAGELAYWIDFDEPQLDVDDDGPYRKALIWDRYLESL